MHFFLEVTSVKKITQFIVSFLLIINVASGSKIDSVTLQLKWTHQYQFAGFYMAKEKGFFKAAGIEVKIKEAHPKLNVEDEVVNGNAQFGIGMPSLLVKRSQGYPVVMLYPIFHHSPLIIISKKDSNIRTPFDLIGKTLMIETKKDAQIEAMFKDVGVDYTMINTVSHTWKIEDLISNKVDAMTAYVTSQPYEFKKKNIDVSIMDPKTYGVDFFGDCLFTSEEFLLKNRRIVNTFIATSKEGWNYALENIDETIDVILSNYNRNLDRGFLENEAFKSKDLIHMHTREEGEDDIHENRWKYIKSVYTAKNQMENDVNLKEFIYNQEEKTISETLRKQFYLAVIILLVFLLILILVVSLNWKLRKEIEKRIKIEQEKSSAILKQKELDELLYKTLVAINEMHQLSIQEIMDYALEKAVKLTDSKIGYIYFYSEKTEKFSLFSWSKSVMPECKVVNPQTEYELSETGLWGDAIRQRKPIITNDNNALNKFMKDIPKGYVTLKSHMNVPIFYEGEIVALIGVGNKENDYTDTDIRHLSILMDGVWLIKTQRKMQRKLEESETLYRSLFDNAAEGIALINVADCKLEYINNALSQILGYDYDEIKGIDFFELVKEEKEKSAELLYDAVNSSNSSYYQDIRIAHKDGTNFFFDLRAKKVDVFEKTYVLVLFANITERKNAEEEVRKINEELELRIEKRTKELKETLVKLSESEEMHRVMFETMTQGVVYQNKDGFVTRVNDAAVRLLGVDLDQFQGRTSLDPRWRTIYEDGSDYPGEDHPAMVALKTGEVIKNKIMGVFNPKIEDYVWINVTAVPLFRENEKKPYQVYATLEDITEKRKVELELKKAKENAERANRAKSEFLANMSHEIRTPLNAVTGFSELLSNLLVDKKQKSYVTSIKSAGKSLLTLINDILDLSKIEAGMMEISHEPVSIRALFMEMRSIFSVKAKDEHLDFNIIIPDDFPEFLLLDETRLRQILLNLIGNAFKFTHSGFVEVECKMKNRNHQKSIDVGISVKDSGIGIRKEEQKDIFESFKQQEGQSNRRYGGTGLGLSICKKLIEMMNGEISIESSEGNGSQFNIILNDVLIINDLRFDHQSYNEFDYTKLVFDNPKILVVDDIASNRDFICELLRKHNCTTIEALNGEEAVQIAKSDKPDVILMDIRMPVLDGKKAAQIIKSDNKLKNTPIIALTASVTQRDSIEIQNMGFDDFLLKPVDVNLLFKELRDALGAKIIEENVNFNQNEIKYVNVEKKILDSLIKEIEDLVQEFQSLISVMKMNKLKEFVIKLKNKNVEFSYEPLAILSSNLELAISTFDVISIKDLEKDMNKIIENLNQQKRESYDW